MSMFKALKTTRAYVREILRPLFEDKEMRGDDFSHLRVTGSGCLEIDEESDAYKRMKSQHPNKVLKHETSQTTYPASSPRVDSLGKIILPLEVRKEIGSDWSVKYSKSGLTGYVIIVMPPDIESREEDQLR